MSGPGPQPEPAAQAGRLPSLDQFRGYTVLAMVVVNFLGGFEHAPRGLRHHNTYASYADTVMPQFFFAVGFGMRLSFLRRRGRGGPRAAYAHALRRCGLLILLGVAVYGLTGERGSWDALRSRPVPEVLLASVKRQPFEALTHIGVTSLWVLPVVGAPGRVRAAFALLSAAAHVLASYRGYYDWNLSPPAGIDGGPLGFLTWAVPVVAGTLAHDWVTRARRPALRLAAWGAALMCAGTALSLAGHPEATPPFMPPAGKPGPGYWLMSQKAGSVPYLLFGAGFAMWVYLAALELADRRGLGLAYFTLLGRHALAAYLIHGVVAGAFRPLLPKDSPAWWLALGLAAYVGVTTVFVRYLDRNGLHLKL